METNSNAATQAEFARLESLSVDQLTTMLDTVSESVARLRKQFDESIEATEIQVLVLRDANDLASKFVAQAVRYGNLLQARITTKKLIQEILEHRWKNGAPYPSV